MSDTLIDLSSTVHENTQVMLAVCIVMIMTYIAQIAILVKEFTPNEIKESISEHREKGKVALTKIVMKKAASQ